MMKSSRQPGKTPPLEVLKCALAVSDFKGYWSMTDGSASELTGQIWRQNIGNVSVQHGGWYNTCS